MTKRILLCPSRKFRKEMPKSLDQNISSSIKYKWEVKKMERIIFHIDVNSAYLSWESAYILSHGGEIDYRKIPAIVGGDQSKRKGIVLAKSEPAKALGVSTGESIYSALNKCPDLHILPAHYDRYIRASDALVDLIKKYTPKTQRYSIDELFADMSVYGDDYMEFAQLISSEVKEKLGFTVNIGIGPNKLLAKMASDFEKPDKIHTLFHDEIEEKMWPLDVGELFMVGRRTKAKLNSRGIRSIGDLAHLDRNYMRDWLKKPGLKILNYARGIENSPVRTEDEEIKSIGNSTTTAFDVETREEAERFILAICEMIGIRLRKVNMCGQVISISIKNFDFYYRRMQRRIYSPTDNTEKIFEIAYAMFLEIWDSRPIRQFRVSISDLCSNDCVQLSIFDKTDEKARRIDKSVDEIRERYGMDSIERSTFLHSGIKHIIGGVIEEKEYPMMKSDL